MRKKNPPKINDGEKYGRWLVLSVERVGNYYRGNCLCECGKTGSVRQDTLLNGQSTSCGCYSKEVVRVRVAKKGGITNHPLYQRWYDMNRRCFDASRKDFHHYGGRGISVCADWVRTNPNGFHNFLQDMESSYVEGLEIDRIDNDGDYCKDNCKWSTRSEQVINSRTLECNIGDVRWLNDGEETLHLAAMAKKYGLSSHTLQDRISKLGWTIQTALNTPLKVKQHGITYQGQSYKISDIFVTNVSSRSKTLCVTPSELLRAVLIDDVTVQIYTGQSWITVQDGKAIEDKQPYVLTDERFLYLFKPEILCRVRQEKSPNYKSPYEGVWFDRKLGKFRARINIAGVRVSLGYHKTEVDAAEAIKTYLEERKRGSVNDSPISI